MCSEADITPPRVGLYSGSGLLQGVREQCNAQMQIHVGVMYVPFSSRL